MLALKENMMKLENKKQKKQKGKKEMYQQEQKNETQFVTNKKVSRRYNETTTINKHNLSYKER